MGIKEKFAKTYSDYYFKKYGDRLTQIQGNVVSYKVEEKSILWLFHKLTVTLLIRPERSKNVIKCIYRKNKWFKKPAFIPVAQGNLLFVAGMKSWSTTKGKNGKETREFISIINVKNMNTKKELFPFGDNVKTVRKVQRIR